jgi:hypothetical protein
VSFPEARLQKPVCTPARIVLFQRITEWRGPDLKFFSPALSLFFEQNTKHKAKAKHTQYPNSTMTLIKCISLTALLSGVATTTADSADNVSSRLQVHVRDNNDPSSPGQTTFLRGNESCFVSFRSGSLYYFILDHTAYSRCERRFIEECYSFWGK